MLDRHRVVLNLRGRYPIRKSLYIRFFIPWDKNNITYTDDTQKALDSQVHRRSFPNKIILNFLIFIAEIREHDVNKEKNNPKKQTQKRNMDQLLKKISFVWLLVLMSSMILGNPLKHPPSSHKEKCTALIVEQTYKIDGCRPIKLDVQGCKGRCNSFYIPVFGQEAAQICRACLPKYAPTNQTFECLGKDNRYHKTVIAVDTKLTGCACQNVDCSRWCGGVTVTRKCSRYTPFFYKKKCCFVKWLSS